MIGPKLLGNATDVIVARRVSARTCPRATTKAQVIAELKATGQGSDRRLPPMASTFNPGHGIDFESLGYLLLLVLAPLRVLVGLRLAAGLRARGRDPAHHVPAAPGCRGQDQPAAPPLRRPARTRRAAEPGDQRHRQHLSSPCSRPCRS